MINAIYERPSLEAARSFRVNHFTHIFCDMSGSMNTPQIEDIYNVWNNRTRDLLSPPLYYGFHTSVFPLFRMSRIELPSLAEGTDLRGVFATINKYSRVTKPVCLIATNNKDMVELADRQFLDKSVPAPIIQVVLLSPNAPMLPEKKGQSLSQCINAHEEKFRLEIENFTTGLRELTQTYDNQYLFPRAYEAIHKLEVELTGGWDSWLKTHDDWYIDAGRLRRRKTNQEEVTEVNYVPYRIVGFNCEDGTVYFDETIGAKTDSHAQLVAAKKVPDDAKLENVVLQVNRA